MVDVDYISLFKDIARPLIQNHAQVIARIGNGNAGQADDIRFAFCHIRLAGDKEPDLFAPLFKVAFEQGHVIDHTVDDRLIDIAKEDYAHEI